MARLDSSVRKGTLVIVFGMLLGNLSCQGGGTTSEGDGTESGTSQEESATASRSDADTDTDSDGVGDTDTGTDDDGDTETGTDGDGDTDADADGDGDNDTDTDGDVDTDTVSPEVPTVPGNLTVMAVNSCSIGVTWVASTDDVGVTGYNIYRDGVLIDSIDEEPPYNDNSLLSPETRYTYTVSAYDADGNESGQSDAVSATTLAAPLYINPDSEVVPHYALADWTRAGVVNGIPDYSVGVNVMDHGAVGDGQADDTAAIIAALDACPEDSAVLFPEGVYLTTSTIDVSKSIALRGEGPGATVIRHSHSQIGVRLSQGADHAGIEDMHIETVYPFNEAGGEKILFENVENSWIRNIEASGYTYHQVSIVDSSHCEVRDSYIHNSYEKAVVEDYGTFYGVEVMGFHDKATYNLVENNVLDWFSSAMILQHEAQYNVYAYNFSWNVWSENQNGTGYSRTSDFELHHYDYDGSPPSHFIYYLLSEGNVFEQAGVPNSMHRKNMYFRNRVKNGGITLGHDNIAFGNELVEKKNPGTWNPGDADDNAVRTIRRNSISHGNYITVPDPGMVWNPDITDHDIPDSYYLESKPDFFGDLPWPCYGGDMMPGNTRRSPAEVRYWSMMFPEEVPSGLEADGDGNGVALTWHNNSTNDVDFIVCRSGDGENFERIALTPETTYTDTVPEYGQYYYYVRAVNHLGGRNHLGELHGNDLGGESQPSNVFEINTNQ